MLNKSILITILINNMLIVSCGKCPAKHVSHPCICESQTIKCDANQSLSLKRIFNNISQSLSKSEKNFDFFVLNNNALKELEDNVFADITFRFINIINAKSLEKISFHAFNGTETTVEIFEQSGEISLKNASDLLISINSLENLVSISLNIIELKSLPSYAVYNLNHLQELSLINGQLNTISANSFEFRKVSSNVLIIDLTNNNLTEFSFNSGSFDGLRRPIEIDLRDNYITILEKDIFKPLLMSDSRNSLNLRANPLNCFDCRMEWLVKDKHLFSDRVIDARCSHFVSIFEIELTDYKHC